MKPLHLLLVMLLFLIPSKLSAFYDPGQGRWVSRDPIGEHGGENLYGYLKNEPTGSVDLLGMVDVDYAFTTPDSVAVSEQSGSLETVGLTYRHGDVSCSVNDSCEVSCITVAASNILMNSAHQNSPKVFQEAINHEKMHVMSWAYLIKTRVVYGLTGETKRYGNKQDAELAATRIQDNYRAEIAGLQTSPDHTSEPGSSGFSPGAGIGISDEAYQRWLSIWFPAMQTGASGGSSQQGSLFFESRN